MGPRRVPPPVPGDAGGRRAGEAPGRGRRPALAAGLPHRTLPRSSGARAGTPTRASTPESAEAERVPEGETGGQEAGARGPAWDRRPPGASPCAFPDADLLPGPTPGASRTPSPARACVTCTQVACVCRAPQVSPGSSVRGSCDEVRAIVLPLLLAQKYVLL